MDEDEVRLQVEEALAEERKKWEKVVASHNEAEEATEKQVAHLTAQLLMIRERQKEHAESVEQEVTERLAKHVKELTDKHHDEMKKVRLECLTREKNSNSSRALLVERQANEATIMSLGEAEDERVRKKVAQAKAAFEKQLQEKDQELKAASLKIADLEKSIPTDGPNSENLRETVKRERKRTRQAEKQVEAANAEIEQLKQKLVDSKQLHYQGSLENVAREPPETTKLYRQMEQYKNEAKLLRQQLDAQMPGKLFELQSNMKMNSEERDKLKEEVKTLQQILSRQERAIQANKEQDQDYAQKVQVVYGDLQVAKAETVRLKEKLEVAEKGLVSRQKIEEGLRTRAEKAEKKCKEWEKVAAGLREELENSKRKCLALEAARESDRKQGQGKIKERDRLIKSLQEQYQKEKLEGEAKALEVRALTVQLQDLKRDGAVRSKKHSIDIPRELRDLKEGGKDGEKRGQPVPLAAGWTEQRAPSSSLQTERRTSSSRQKVRSRGGEARVNSGMLKLDGDDTADYTETFVSINDGEEEEEKDRTIDDAEDEEADHPEDDAYWQDAQFEEVEDVLEPEAEEQDVAEV